MRFLLLFSSFFLFLVPVSDIAASESHASFQFRGVIEGFYGPPWPEEDRLDLLQWMDDHQMNIYVHAPKKDPYQRLRWRQPYPDETMKQFLKEVRLSQRLGLRWVPSISPGYPMLEAAKEHDQDICFSCPEDRQILYQKLDAFWKIGVRSFMISFDDVIKISTHPEDAATYGTGDYVYGVMNAELLNAVYERYSQRSSSFQLLTVPADYFGSTTTPYLEGFRSRLRKEILVMWTGTEIVDPHITCEEAKGYAQAIGRKPLLWDNFPVNDYAPNKLIIGPYKGRSPDLPSCLQGILSNPANQARANKIPLFTVVDYLNDPSHYDPEASWQRSLQEFAGKQVNILRPFVENVRSTPLDRTESVRFSQLSQRFLESLSGPHWTEAYQALVDELNKERTTPQKLRNQFFDKRFIKEIDPPQSSWLERLAFNAENGLEAAKVLAETRPRVEATFQGDVLTGQIFYPANAYKAQQNVNRLKDLRNRDDGNPPNVHGDRYFNALGHIYVNENRMDHFYDDAVKQAVSYVPEAPLASRSVRMTVNGQRVYFDEDGRFQVAVNEKSAVIVLTDGANHQTIQTFKK